MFFLKMTEGTLAGIAAGKLATGQVSINDSCKKSKKINIFVNDELVDIALVDVAITNQMFLGAKAIWDPTVIDSIFLTRAEPLSIGLASIGAKLKTVSIDEPQGLFVNFRGKSSISVKAPLAPGKVHKINISSWGDMIPGKYYLINSNQGTIGLDGEREIELLPKNEIKIVLDLNGPYVVDVESVHKFIVGKGQ